MTSSEPRRVRPPRRRRRTPVVLRWSVRVAVACAVFAAGIALGQALDDNPKPARTRTVVRTLKPLPINPVPVTVTVTAPG